MADSGTCGPQFWSAPVCTHVTVNKGRVVLATASHIYFCSHKDNLDRGRICVDDHKHKLSCRIKTG